MGQPTSIAVTSDRTEYSRYEVERNTVAAIVQVQGGATYSNERVYVELIKARRSRDAVVAVSTLTFNGATDVQITSTPFVLQDIIDQDLINLVRHGRYFLRARSLATGASAVIGTASSAPMTITTIDTGVDTNAFTVDVVVPSGTGELAVLVSGTTVTVNLAVIGGVPQAAKNTREKIKGFIAEHLATQLVASFTGTANLSLTTAEGTIDFTGGRDEVSGVSADFDIRIISVDRLKSDYLFGIPLYAGSVKQIKFQPNNVTGVTVKEVSKDHSLGVYPLTYNYIVDALTDATASIGTGTDGTVSITADHALEGTTGNAWSVQVVVPSGTSGLSITTSGTTLTVHLAVSSSVPVNGSNTATLIASAVSILANFTAVASGTGASPLTAAEGPTAFVGGTDRTSRTLSWNGGPIINVSNPGIYLLRSGGPNVGGLAKQLITSGFSTDYVVVHSAGTAFLPTSAQVDELLVDYLKIDDDALARYIDQATAWVENTALAIFVEPTNVVTDRDPTTIQFAAGINSPTPLFTDPDYDFIHGPLTYYVPRGGQEWIDIQTPYSQLLRVDSLFGSIANTRVIDIDLDWIHFYPQGGFIQLVPFNQTIAFDFLGLIWVNAIRGAVAIPNFWHFNIIAGLRDAPGDIQELIAKKAAVEALMELGAAFKPGMGSLSLGRDGVSQSISYTSQAKYGVYTGPITTMLEWIDRNLQRLKGHYAGAGLRVV